MRGITWRGRFCITPRKPRKMQKKRVFETKTNPDVFFSDVKQFNAGNYLKRVLTKFDGDGHFVQGANGRSKFDDFFGNARHFHFRNLMVQTSE